MKIKKAYRSEGKMCIIYWAPVNLLHIVVVLCVASTATNQFRYFSYFNVNYESSTIFLFYFIFL
jgi:hypothetical protein